MTTYGMLLHPRADVQRLYLPRGQAGRGLKSVEDCVRLEEAGLADYVQSSTRALMVAVAKGRATTQRKDTGPEATERAEKIRASRGFEEQTFAWPVSVPNRGD